MKKGQNAKLNMYLAVQLWVLAKQLVWQGLAAFGIAFTEFQAIVQSILDAKEKQEKALHGYTVEKEKRKGKMASIAERIRSAVQAYATTIGDEVLFAAVNFSESKIMQKNGNTARTWAQIVHDQANGVIANLGTYGVVAGDLTAFQTAIDDFGDYISQPKNTIAEIASATADLKKLFKDADANLKKKLDKLMENFRESAPDFYAQYFIDRKIYNAPTNYTELLATLKNKQTQEVMQGVNLHAVSSEVMYDLKSNALGVVDKKKIKPGAYDLTFSKTGFLPVTMSGVEVGSGKKVELSVELIAV